MLPENLCDPTAGREDVPEVLAIIPARGGSKGIPRKNITPLLSKPLIAYSIQTALATPSIGRVVVSTDDEEIAAIARDWGAEVPIMRPMELATDTALIGNCISHMMTYLLQKEGYSADAQVVLYPSHPFRTPSLVDSMIRSLFEGNYATATTFRRIEAKDTIFCHQKTNRRIESVRDRGQQPGIRHYSRSYGSVVIRSTHFQAYSHYAYVLSNPFELIDIDEWSDLFFAEEVVKHQLYDFEL